MFFAHQRAFTCTQNLILEVLQLGCDVTLCSFECLAANVIGRRVLRLGFADFNVITVHPVISHFQRSEIRPFFLAVL